MSSLEFGIANQDLIKVATALISGGLLGLERQYKNKTAGFRTIILICMGSAIFTMIAQRFGQVANINIVTGVGFIGAGVIFKDNISVSGLTTAAVIWISAAIGMAAGSGNYSLALICTVTTLIVLLLFSLLERYIDKIHRDKLFVIAFTNAEYDQIRVIEQLVSNHNLRFRIAEITKKDGCLQLAILVTGHKQNIREVDRMLLLMPQIKSF